MNPSSVFSPSSTRRNPEAISRRAYEIWNQEGRPNGCDLRHWLQAEQELSAEAGGNDSSFHVSGNGNGVSNGNGSANGTAPESSATNLPSPTPSLTGMGTQMVPTLDKLKRASTADTPGKAGGKTTARGGTPPRKATGSGRRPGL